MSPLVSPLDSSFWDCFGSFLLPWIDQSHEWKLSTEGNPLIPHEIADSGNFSSWPIFWGILQFLRFTELEFVSGHDPLEVAFLLACEPLCKVSSLLEGFDKLWLDLIFPEKLLVHTGRVQYDLGRVRYFSLWSFELKFGGDLPLVSKELWLKFHDFWTPFDGVSDFSLLVSFC